MITFELAKQLKEAGFPQEAEEGDRVYYRFGEKEYDYEWVPITEEEHKINEKIKRGEDVPGFMSIMNSSAFVLPGGSLFITTIDGVECKKVYKDTFKIIGERWEEIVLSCDEDKGEWWLGDEDDYIKIPSLSELIEACGDNFIQLHHNRIKKPKWVAFGKNNIEEFGKTEEEVVAKLYLKLNER